jgi:DNA-binding IclR family transcriptional regulator
VEGIIKRSRNGATIDTLVEKTGIERKKVHNVLFRLRRLGKVVKTEKGSYTKQVK